MARPLSAPDQLAQRANRLKRILKRRLRYLGNILRKRSTWGHESTLERDACATGTALLPGDRVRVKSMEEIRTSLDNWNQLRGCAFMEEMRPYCGTTQRVFKRVEQFLDERDYLVKRCRGIVLLEGVLCEGTKDFGRCDRSCYFFWRQEWLEKIDSAT